jgi:hypothetical protein
VFPASFLLHDFSNTAVAELFSFRSVEGLSHAKHSIPTQVPQHLRHPFVPTMRF